MKKETYESIEKKVKDSVLKTWSEKELADLYNTFLDEKGGDSIPIIDLENSVDVNLESLYNIYHNSKPFEHFVKIPRFIVLVPDGHYEPVEPRAYVRIYWSDIFLRAMAYPYAYENIGKERKSLYSDEIHPQILSQLGITIDPCLNTIQFK
jgi:hypothetical protein